MQAGRDAALDVRQMPAQAPDQNGCCGAHRAVPVWSWRREQSPCARDHEKGIPIDSGLRLGRIAGIDIHADWSLLIIFVLIASSLAMGLFPEWHPDWGPGLIWATALGAAVALFASVLVHELSHALVGRARAITVRRITLFVFGGVAQMEREPPDWRAEFWMAIVGPVTSAVLGFLCFLCGRLLARSRRGRVRGTRRAVRRARGRRDAPQCRLGQVNFVLAASNLVRRFRSTVGASCAH